MRLVNADFVIAVAEKEFSEEDASKVRWLLSHIPTAYDPNEVCNQASAYFNEVIGQVGTVEDKTVRESITSILSSIKKFIGLLIVTGGEK